MKLLVPAIICALLLSTEAKSQSGNGNSTDRKFLRAKLYAGNGNIADGNVVAFDDDFSNGYDGYDAVKMTNPGENFGMRRDGRILSAEARNHLTPVDTIYYDIQNLATNAYYFRFNGQHFQGTTLLGMLKDKFTGTITPITLTDTTYYQFSITGNPASKVFDRFTLFFSDLVGLGALPVKFTAVNVYQPHKLTLRIDWRTEEELNVQQYDVERSSDGTNFTKLGTVHPAASHTRMGSYHFDSPSSGNQDAFYRIVAIDIDHKKTISKLVKTAGAANMEAAITAWPNPLRTDRLQVRLTGVSTGKYKVAVTSLLGQQVYTSQLAVNQPDVSFPLVLGSQVANGQYLITLTGENGQVFQQKLMIKK